MAGAAGLEPTTPGFGDQCSAKLSYAPSPVPLLGLAMQSMTPTTRTVAAELDATWIVLLVLLRRIRSFLALGARKRDDGPVFGFCHLSLVLDGRDGPGTDGPATFADREAHAGFEGDGGDELDIHVDVVTGHDHLGTVLETDGAGDIGGAQVELRPIPVVEGGVTPALVLGQDVDTRGELRVGLDAARLGEHLATLDLLALDAAQERADVVTGLARVEQLVEHLDAGHGDLAGRLDADHLDLLADVDGATLDTTGRDGAAALDGEDVLDRHEEGLVDLPLRGGDVAVDRVHQLGDGRIGLIGDIVAGLEGREGRTADDGDVVTGELVLAEQLAHLELDELEQFLVVDHVDLVEEDHDVGHLHLAGQQDVLTRLGHRSIGGRDHEDGAVHLGGPGDHVLDVVGVTGAVDVRVVTRVGLVLDVGDGDGDAALTLLGRVVDRIEGTVLRLTLEGRGTS